MKSIFYFIKLIWIFNFYSVYAFKNRFDFRLMKFILINLKKNACKLIKLIMQSIKFKFNANNRDYTHPA